MTKPIPTSLVLRRLFEDGEYADSMGFMPRADLFMTALEGMHKGDTNDSVTEALSRVAAVENPSELNTFLGLPTHRKAY
jgi:hypothetical protein